MLLDQDIAVVSNHVNISFFYRARRQVPVAWIFDIWLMQPVLVYKEFTISKLYRFSFKSNYTLEKHNLLSCKTHCHNIMVFGIGKEISGPPAAINIIIMVCGLHALAADFKRDADIAEKDARSNSDDADSDEKAGCKRGEKKSF